MELYRDIVDELNRWKDRVGRNPLILEGARQVGKTWVMKKFGESSFGNSAYFNFESSPELASEFRNTKSPQRLIRILELYCGFDITPGKTLIILDEIQECVHALNSLKYFAEEAPQYHVMAAGSLLGVAMARGGTFPVGKVDFLRMYPLSFREFLYSADKTLFDFMESFGFDEALPQIVHNRMREEYRRYLICGGMPKAVLAMLQLNDIGAVDTTLDAILHSYSLDFSKHASVSDVPRISEIWKSIPSQLAKENRKFIYKLVRPGARAREYENALLWLQQAGLVYRVNCNSNPAIPLSAYDDISAFKVYVFDIGILRAMSKLPASALLSDNSLFSEFKGAYIENAILQSLVTQYQVPPRYWVSAGRAEVDFILQTGETIVPVEVKYDGNTSGKSLSVYIRKYSPRTALIISGENVRRNADIMHLPHPAADWLSRLATP